MSVDFKSVFQLDNNFTKEQLKIAFLKKVQEINNNNNLSDIDKRFWVQEINKLYINGKRELAMRENNINLFDNQRQLNLFNRNNNLSDFNNIISNHINNFNDMISSMHNDIHNINNHNINNHNINNKNISNTGYFKSYKSVIGNDGIKYVQEIDKTINNDKIDSKIKTYKVDKDGKKIYINPNDVKQLK
jgi:hypothetical protein